MKKPDIWNCSKEEWAKWVQSPDGKSEFAELIRRLKLNNEVKP